MLRVSWPRFCLLLTLVLTGLFGLLIGAIRVQPVDAAAVGSFFAAATDCPAPCFMGIRLGVTTTDEALAILEADSSAGAVALDADRITWAWADDPDTPFDTAGDTPSIRVSNGRVVELDVPLSLRLGDLVAIYGLPRWHTISQLNSGTSASISYPMTQTALLELDIPCPITPARLWHSPLRLVTNARVFNGYLPDNSPRLLKRC
jgi:hypothetical protein